MLLTRRERKIMNCIGEAIGKKRDYSNSSELVDQVERAVDSIIQVLGEQDIAEQLSPWEEDFYQSSK